MVDRGRRLERLAGAGTGRRVRNFDVPDPEAAARSVAESLTRGPGVTVTRTPGRTTYHLPEGGRIVLRAPSASSSGLWAVDVHKVPGHARIIRTHFRYVGG